MSSHVASEVAENGNKDSPSYVRRVCLTLALVALAVALWRIRDAVLLLIASIVLAVVLSRLADFVKRVTHLPRLLSLWVVILAGIGLLTLFVFVFIPQVGGELQRLSDSIMQSKEALAEREWGRALLGSLPNGVGDIQWGSIFSSITGVASSVFNFFTALFLLVFLTLFLAANPSWYINGVVDTFPKHRRDRARQVICCAGEGLWRWLIGQALAMLTIGILSTIGMFVVGMRFAILLGVLAGLFQFIPFIGPVLWAVPATLLALGESPQMAVKVLIVYTTLQLLEGNLITPIAQRREANVPPAVILLSTVVLGLLFGPLGVILAAPMSVVMLVFYQMLYRQDILKEGVPPLGSKTD